MSGGTEEKRQTDVITLSSTRSMQISLQAVRSGKAGLDAHRQSMLNRVPEIGDWASFKYEFIMLKDLAYLTAKRRISYFMGIRGIAHLTELWSIC
nr:hypothetical protein [uncultured Schaedlerella sp.]